MSVLRPQPTEHFRITLGSQFVFLMVHDGPKIGRHSCSNFVRFMVVDQLSDHRGPLLLRKKWPISWITGEYSDLLPEAAPGLYILVQD